MPRATIASRQLKNKDTGIDLFVLSYNEIQKLMTSSVYYQVVLVSNLACFKTPSHKESDVVQYSIDKSWSEFEDLRTKISELFSGTVLPSLNKKSIIVNDHVLRERRNNLDQFVKFIASVPKIATCAPLLEFLGVDSMKAKGFSQGGALESTHKHSNNNEEEITATASEEQVDIFEDDANDETNKNLFDSDDKSFADDEALFGSESSRVQVAMFEQQDMAGELTEEDEKNLGYLPDAIITKKETVRIALDDDEDNSDLLTIEDDLDKLMIIDVGKKEKSVPKEEDSFLSSLPPTDKPKPSTDKPTTPTKPTPASKPKPPTKPKVASDFTSEDEPTKSKPLLPDKPKPVPKPRPRTNQQETSAVQSVDSQSPSSSDTILSKNVTESGHIDTLGQDDILTYLQANLTTTTDDVDLFS